MKRIIYSLYIDIPKEELDWQIPYFGDEMSKTERTKLKLAEYADWLESQHKRYADALGIEYRLYGYDEDYKAYEQHFKENYPQITAYNIVNFYKLHLLYKLSEEFDEILYLDFDVVPMSNNNFFDVWDLSKGVAILTNRTEIDTSFQQLIHTKRKRETYGRIISNRSPTAKYWNCLAMLMEMGYSNTKTDVYNTGIVGINKQHLEQLDYFGDFKDTLALMDELKTDEDSMWPDHIKECFGWDNETIWGYKMIANNVNRQLLSEDWHHFMDKWSYIPDNTNLVHVINKDFKYVKRFYEKNNL